ncbi:ClpP family protease [Brachybacterium alimentarium]|uniref:ClpP family protease n=1 Tax=Brachybacterium alimentarium TaxID=47845 RepID=UPI000DF2BD9B|nr:ATP-dependent Clp protease proteolytic subunit [Brachybacterium alimentarium]RCS71829.1 ATP-dependent Clp protease proteolytic subunit [Brachybacterium alimentarium]RCS79937.1 ATP-dependent Clp protease proteolytic subunit [Brachybacterium alimentarium]
MTHTATLPHLEDSAAAPAAAGLGALTATRLLHHRVLILDRELDQDNGAQLSAQLLLLAAEDPRQDITLLINSPGGLVPAMLAIGDLMDLVPCDVRTVALGMAYSAGQFLLTHGTPGKRMILPHGRVLMHQGSAGFGGSAADIELQAEDLRRSRDLLIALTAQRTGQSAETIAQDSDRDRLWDAEGAVEYGFCDRIVTSLDEVLPLGIGARAGTSLGVTGVDASPHSAPSGDAR